MGTHLSLSTLLVGVSVAADRTPVSSWVVSGSFALADLVASGSASGISSGSSQGVCGVASDSLEGNNKSEQFPVFSFH